LSDGYYQYKANTNENQNENKNDIIEKDNDNKNIEITRFFKENHDKLFIKQNVVGVGIGQKFKNGQNTGESCITYFVSQKLDATLIKDDDLIADNISGFKTDVIETGVIFAGDALAQKSAKESIVTETLSQRIRPAKGGYSVGHYLITAGTIATIVYDSGAYGIPSKYYILSNNHVLANSNNASIGDPILQPGPYDGGTVSNDTIARLTRYVPINFKTTTTAPINYVDAAIAEGDFQNLNREIYWIGYVNQVNTSPKVNSVVMKTGRTTNFSTGTILSINATVDVNYGSGLVARFANQIVTTVMTDGGDSGSLLCDTSRNVVGLIFAGSSTTSVANKIANVQSLLGIRLTP